MNKLYLIAATAIIAASLPALAEDKPGMMEEKTEQHGPQMMGEQGTHMTHKETKETMWKHMQARNAELDKLVETMNSAQGTEKVDAIAAVVNKIVEIHMDMNNWMMQMHKSGMWHGCPMKGMMGGKMMEREEMGSGMMEKGKGTTKEEEQE